MTLEQIKRFYAEYADLELHQIVWLLAEVERLQTLCTVQQNKLAIARFALKSYQYGNSAPDLAADAVARLETQDPQ